MTPAARVQTAIELLEPILNGAPAERVLTQWARRSRFAGSKDRAAIRDHVFDVLRRKNSAANSGGNATPRGLMIGLLRLQGQDLDAIFTGANYAPETLTKSERESRFVNEVVDLPEWVVPEFRSSLGEKFTAVEKTLKDRAPIVLRVNLRKGSVEDAQRSLRLEGIETQQHLAADTALKVVEGTRKIRNSAAYRKGEIELQDAASQAAINLLPQGNLGKVLDYCAGGGGKLLAMAARNDGQYFAHDANESRLRDLPDRCQRAGIKAKILPSTQLSQTAPFDFVFCDVPCSGSGTWRRDPDGKWKLTSESLYNILALQREILKSASKLVAKNGLLAYATCSLLEAENRRQIEAFRSEHPNWSLRYQESWTPLDDCDGFYTALLQKDAS